MTRPIKTDEDQRLIDEWLAKGNTVTQCDALARTDPDDIVYTFKAGKRGRKAKTPSDE